MRRDREKIEEFQNSGLCSQEHSRENKLHRERVDAFAETMKQKATEIVGLTEATILETARHDRASRKIFYNALHQIREKPIVPLASFGGLILLVWGLLVLPKATPVTPTLEPTNEPALVTPHDYRERAQSFVSNRQFEKAMEVNAKGRTAFPKDVGLVCQHASLLEATEHIYQAIDVLDGHADAIRGTTPWEVVARQIYDRCQLRIEQFEGTWQ